MVKADRLALSNEILNLISEIDEFKGAWKLIGKLAPERLKALKKVATIESVGSSTRIEGAMLSNKEVERLLSRIDTYSFRSRDEEEVAGYAAVCEEIFSSYNHIPFTENTIKQLHGWLLKYTEKDVRHRGEYKKFPNHVEAFDAEGKSLGIIFKTTSPFDTPKEVQELLHWTQEALKGGAMHPLLVIAIFVVTFLAIHPFQDGNGRLSRVLTTLLLLQQGYTYVPYSSLESIVEENKESYYLALRKTQATLSKSQPDYDPWLLFFLRSLVQQKKRLENKIEREQKIGLHMSEVAAKLLELVQEHGRLSVSDIIRITGMNRNTVKKNLQSLVKTGQLVMRGKGRGTWYTIL